MTEIQWGPVGKEVYERTYRRVKHDGEFETWPDTVRRVVDGNLALVDERFEEPGERDKLYDLILNFGMLPAGRHLWVSGVPGRQFLFNCHRAGFTDNLADHFTFTFDELMKGGGVGANYSNRYIERSGLLQNTVEVHVVCDEAHGDYEELKPHLSTEYSYKWDGTIRIPDTREGWVDALEALLDAYNDSEPSVLVFDVSIIREKGQPIRGFGGTASGPSALAIMLHNVAEVCNKRVGESLSSLDFMKIDHEIAQCVVAGNVRRSARMSIKSWKDFDIFDFIDCKDKDDQGLARDHWTTNISVEIDDDFFSAIKSKKNPDHIHAQNVYMAVVTGMLRDGEPGFYNLSLASDGELQDVGSTNPCGEIALEEWENCNLGHINLDKFVGDFEGAKEAYRLMTRFLIRATFSNITNPRQAEVVARNRRIGVGFFGFQSWLAKQGIRFSDSHRNRYVRKTLRDFKAVVDKEKARFSHVLRIPVPIKGTTLAPTGSVSQLAGSTQSIQTIYSPYFKRRIRFSDTDPALKDYEEQGYEIEDCVYSANTKVVTFYCKDPLLDEVDDEDLVEGAFDVPFEDFLAVQAMVQECYADNAISFTINIKPNEMTVDQAAATIIHYLPHLKGTTVFPDMSREQSPLEVISKAEFELAEYIKSSLSGEMECAGAACPVK